MAGENFPKMCVAVPILCIFMFVESFLSKNTQLMKAEL